jgi:putative transcriptional regulator
MKDELFEKLAESVKQAGEICHGELEPGRVFEYTPVDVKAIRKKLQKTQTEFAQMIGVRVATLRNWEQGRRRPDGPAQALLRVAEQNPAAVAEALSGV